MCHMNSARIYMPIMKMNEWVCVRVRTHKRVVALWAAPGYRVASLRPVRFVPATVVIGCDGIVNRGGDVD